MKIKRIKVLLLSSLFVISATGLALASECIAPANPGGGWDFTCRQIGKVMYDIKAIDKPMQVTNMAGAGGGLAFNHVVAERNEDAELIVAASSATTTRLAQNAYAGMTADQVRFVGAIGADPGVIVLDEAFSAMDPETERRVRRNLFKAFADRAILAISHRLTGLEQFDRLLLMQGGHLRQVGKQELFDYFEINSPREQQHLNVS